MIVLQSTTLLHLNLESLTTMQQLVGYANSTFGENAYVSIGFNRPDGTAECAVCAEMGSDLENHNWFLVFFSMNGAIAEIIIREWTTGKDIYIDKFANKRSDKDRMREAFKFYCSVPLLSRVSE